MRPNAARPAFRLAITVLVLASTVNAATARIVARSAGDLCDDGADPCIVDDKVLVLDHSTLDFGTRTLEIAAHGTLRLARQVVIRAGRIVVAPRDGVAIRQVTRGSRDVEASVSSMRTCSAGGARCLGDSHCDLSGCGSQFCEGDPSLSCVPGYERYFCALRCDPSGTCAGTDHSCSSDADCDFGSCGAATFCNEWTVADGPVACTTNADCNLGHCSIGDGSIEIGGEIRSQARGYGGLFIEAAGSITVDAPVSMTAPTPTSWSDLVFDSRQGSVLLRGRILHQSDDAVTNIWSRLDVEIDGDIVMPGGSGLEGYSGWLEIDAGRDALLRGGIDLSSRRGGLEGGQIDIRAFSRAVLDGGDPQAPMRVRANGAAGLQVYDGGGEGGEVYVRANEEVVVGPSVRIEALGGGPKALGGAVFVGDSDLVRIAGQIDANGHDAVIAVDGSGIEVGEGSRLSVDSIAANEGGRVMMSGCDIRLEGEIQLGSGVDTVPDDPRYRGRSLDLRGANLTLASSARIASEQAEGQFLFQATEAMLSEPGAVVDNPAGTNSVVHGSSSQPPVLGGSFTPAPDVTLDATLPPCTP